MSLALIEQVQAALAACSSVTRRYELTLAGALGVLDTSGRPIR